MTTTERQRPILPSLPALQSNIRHKERVETKRNVETDFRLDGYLNFNQSQLNEHWRVYVSQKVRTIEHPGLVLQVPTFPDVLRDFRTDQQTKTREKRGHPLFVPPLSTEQLAEAFGDVRLEKLRNGYFLYENNSSGWTLVELSPTHPSHMQQEPLGKKTRRKSPTLVHLGLREWMVFRQSMYDIAGQFPDENKWVILGGCSLGGFPITAVGMWNGEFKMRMGFPGTSSNDAVWAVGWRDLTKA